MGDGESYEWVTVRVMSGDGKDQTFTGGYPNPDLTTVNECTDECMDTFEYCAAVDLYAGKCFIYGGHSSTGGWW